ncbi:MAG: PilZ domain-containing protein [Pseudomonadota bacterium]
MRTRKSSRKSINVPGRYFTGLGDPVDVTLSDLSEGGCRFPIGNQKLNVGAPMQIYVASSGPHRASVRWIDDGQAGVTFASPLPTEQFEKFQVSHVPDSSDDAEPGEFEIVPNALPQRYC